MKTLSRKDFLGRFARVFCFKQSKLLIRLLFIAVNSIVLPNFFFTNMSIGVSNSRVSNSSRLLLRS